MKKITLIFATAIISFCSTAQSFTALYPFDSVKTTSGTTDPTPLPTATGVTFGSFTAVGTPANPNATGRFSFTDWSLGALTGETIYANLTGSANTSEYYEVTIAPTGVYTLSLNSISFTFTRSGTGVRTYSVRSDADGFAANLPASISPANPNLSVQAGDIFFLNTDITSNQNGSTITLSGAAFTNISVARTFRFYGFNAEGTGGTFSIDNVLIDGVATAPAVLNADFGAPSVCFGNPNSFTDLSTGPNTIISWLWDFGDGSGTSVLQNPLYTYSVTGTYTVSLLVTDNMANTDSYVTTVSVYENPVAMFTAPTSICAGTVAQFLDGSTISSGVITNWDWNFGDPLSGAANTSILQNPQHNYYTQMMYTATEIVTSDMGCKDTTTISIMVDSLGVALPFVQNADTVVFSGFAFGGTAPYTYLLDLGLGGGFSITSPNYSYQYPLGGPYTACLLAYDNAGCSDTSCVTFTVTTTGIYNAENSDSFNISPNPSSNGLFIADLTNFSGKTTLIVYDIIGNKIFSNEISSQAKQVIDLSNHANGSYFVSIKNDKEVITKKIIVNK